MSDLKRIKPIFSEALDKNGPDRESYLMEACGQDIDLREKVKALLKAHDGAGDFLESPIFDADAAPEDSDISEEPGTVIGRYKLLERIGEGGMSVVYMAEQTEPIRRRVAVKVIKLGMDTKSVIARFEAERQALAMMDHPNIARVLDAGATETGRPYFVMELVKGVSITEYCDNNRVSTPERLRLFQQVCSAVQHAHQKGIIHRDIKPSNVMVTSHDGQPVPKVIDFGIAKATNQKLTEKTYFTRYAQMIGTPAYMSPEQAELSDLDIDTRSDVYSLGVLLYELLTGTTPFSEDELRRAGYLEMQRIIREKEPVRPSTRLGTLTDTLPEIAARRGTTPDLLGRMLRGDLDWITVKALEKDRSRRYETVHALATDIKSHLDCRPVLAVPPSLVYRLKRYVRRNRSQAIIVVLAAILTVVSIGSGIILYRDNIRLKNVKSVLDRDTLSKARDAFMRRRFRDAFHVAKSVMHSTHVGSEAKLLYAASLIEGKRSDQAIQALDRLLNEGPEIAGIAHSLLARIYWESEASEAEKLEKVQFHQQRAQTLLPKTVEAYYLQALTTLSIPEALSFLKQALQTDPGHYESRKLRAFIFNASGSHGDAVEDALAMIVRRPEDPLGYCLQAKSRMALGQYDQAVSDYERFFEFPGTQGKDLDRHLSEYCRCLLSLGRYDETIEISKEFSERAIDKSLLQFYSFCAYVGLGNYETAEDILLHVSASSSSAASHFDDRSTKYVFDMLCAGLPWHASEREPEGKAFLPMLEAEERFRELTTRGTEFIIESGFQVDWSPDGKQLAFSLGTPGFSGLALLDVDTREISLLTVPGKNPRWSPNGQWIAFVRDCQVLPLSDLTSSEPKYQPRSTIENEIWIIRPDGTQARRIAKGDWPSWAGDSAGLYYYWPFNKELYKVRFSNPNAPELMCALPKCMDACPSVSPDNRFVAFVEYDQLNVIDLATGSLVENWIGPPGIWKAAWAADASSIYLAGQENPEVRAGLWKYDRKEHDAVKVMSGQVTYASRSRTGRLAFTLGPPYYRIGLVDADQDFLAGTQSLQDHCKEMIRHYGKALETDASDAKASFFASAYAQYVEALSNRVVVAEQPPGFVFGEPVNLGPPINTVNDEGPPFFSSDGLSLYFCGDRPGGTGTQDLWMSSRSSLEADWGEPVNLGPQVNSEGWDIWPCPSADGLSLYFFSYRKGSLGNGDIWVSHRSSTKDDWGPPENAGENINSPYYDGASVLSADGLEIIFTSMRFGPGQLWICRRDSTDQPWGEAVNLGPTVNGLYFSCAPCLSSDGLFMFFHSTRPEGMGFYDLYVTHRETKDGEWGFPVNLGPTVNSEFGDVCPTVSPDGRWLYFCDFPSSIRPGGHGKTDIWRVPILQWPESKGAQ